jgi:UDP-glucuronate 4-epimerase
MGIHKFTRLMAQGRVVEQYGDGSSARDYTYVDDIVEGIVRALSHCEGFRVWNLGGSRTTTLRDLLTQIAALLGVEPQIKVLEQQPGDVDRTWADISRAEQDLGWSPAVDLEHGLTRFAEWFEEHREILLAARPGDMES